VDHVTDALPLRLTDMACRRWRPHGVVAFELIQAAEFLIPIALEGPGDQAVFGLHFLITPSSPLGLVASAFKPQVPLVINGARVGFKRRDRLQGDGEVRRFDRRSQQLDHGRINPIAAHHLAGFAGKILVQLRTDI